MMERIVALTRLAVASSIGVIAFVAAQVAVGDLARAQTNASTEAAVKLAARAAARATTKL